MRSQIHTHTHTHARTHTHTSTHTYTIKNDTNFMDLNLYVYENVFMTRSILSVLIVELYCHFKPFYDRELIPLAYRNANLDLTIIFI